MTMAMTLKILSMMMIVMSIIIGDGDDDDDDDDGATEPAPSPRSRPAPPSPHRAYHRPVRAPAQGTRENHLGHNFFLGSPTFANRNGYMLPKGWAELRSDNSCYVVQK